MLVDSMPFHSRLNTLDLSKHCSNVDILETLMQGLIDNGIRLKSLILSNNEIKVNSISIINNYLGDECSFYL
jgi:hypothetical protein